MANKLLKGHLGTVTCMSVSSDGNFLASGGDDKTVRIWDTRSQKLLETFRGHRNGVTVTTLPHKKSIHIHIPFTQEHTNYSLLRVLCDAVVVVDCA